MNERAQEWLDYRPTHAVTVPPSVSARLLEATRVITDLVDENTLLREFCVWINDQLAPGAFQTAMRYGRGSIADPVPKHLADIALSIWPTATIEGAEILTDEAITEARLEADNFIAAVGIEPSEP